MELGHIYIIKNKLDEKKMYIGQAKKFRKHIKKEFGFQGRFKEHVTASKKNPTYHFDREMQKIGHENFYVELLEECELTEMDEKEKYYIEKYNTLHPNGYNIVCGNPHTNTNPEVTSEKLKEYYSDETIREKHSTIHMNKFKDIDCDDLSQIEIRPIKEKSVDKLIYVIFRYKKSNEIRRRYGGIHLDFDDNYKRCIDDMKTLNVKCDIIDLVKNPDKIQNNKIANLNTIVKAELKIHTMGKNKLIALCIVDTANNKKKIVFGGKLLSTETAFKNALIYLKNNNVDSSIVYINATIKATLPNCGELLKS